MPPTTAGPKRTHHAATVLLVVLAMLTSAAAPLSVGPGPTPAYASAADLARLARAAGPLGLIARRPDVLTAAQLTRAVTRREGLPAGRRRDLDQLLVAASPAAQGYLAEAFAAGHSVAELREFSAMIAGHGPEWLRVRLRPLDPGVTGPVRFLGAGISQYDDTTCGSTTILAARAVVDPLYAFQLTTGGRPGTAEETDERFADRLRTEEQRIHDATDLLWPQVAGTPPWGLSEQLNQDPAGLGVWHRWTATLHGLPTFADSVLRQALAAVDQGYPVPLLIGDLLPRHYVLLLRHNATGASFYEPTAGEVIFVPARDLDRHDFSALGFAHLQGAVLPFGPMTG